jgi:hypothetical protein
MVFSTRMAVAIREYQKRIYNTNRSYRREKGEGRREEGEEGRGQNPPLLPL